MHRSGSFWRLPPSSMLLPAAVALGFPMYELFLAFSSTQWLPEFRTTP